MPKPPEPLAGPRWPGETYAPPPGAPKPERQPHQFERDVRQGDDDTRLRNSLRTWGGRR